MKKLISLILFPIFLFSNEIDQMSIFSIYNHVKSERIKYEIFLKNKNSNDIERIYQGKKEAYSEMEDFISLNFIID